MDRQLPRAFAFGAVLAFLCAAYAPAQNTVPIRIIGSIPSPGDTLLYTLQVGAFVNCANAQRSFNALAKAGLQPAYETYGNFRRVIISAVAPRDIPRIIEIIWNAGFTEVWIRAPAKTSVCGSI